jgi:hypothetical protein
MVAARPRGLWDYALPVVSILVVGVAVAVALFVSGSPATERRHWADALRTSDLQALSTAVESYYRSEKRLPESVADLTRRDAALQVEERRSGVTYGYRKLGEREYELSATFETDTSREARPLPFQEGRGVWIDAAKPFWKHAIGRQVFRMQVEKPRSSGG